MTSILNAIKVALLTLTLVVMPTARVMPLPSHPTSVALQALGPELLGGLSGLDDATAQSLGAEHLEALYVGVQSLVGEFRDQDTLALLAALPVPPTSAGEADERAMGTATIPTRDPQGSIVQLAGTPHLWAWGGDRSLHWIGDTRALGGASLNWADQQPLSLDGLRKLSIGDPWLSSPLLMRSGDIYLPKWESNQAQPTLYHIQSIADVELFGINGRNYGGLIKSTQDWESETGFRVATLPTVELPSAITGGVRPAPQPPVQPTPQPQPRPAPPTPPATPPVDPALDITNTSFVTRVVNGVQMIYVPNWARLTLGDEDLFVGLVVASTVSPDYRNEVASRIVMMNVDYSWANLPPATHGRTNTTTQSVQVNSRQRGDIGATAAILAHENYHAVFAQRPGFLGCIQDETNAYIWGGQVWLQLPNNLKLGSMRNEMESLVGFVARNGPSGIFQMLQTSPSYIQQCTEH